jgi:DNA-binding response OmpR family regulator
MAVHRDGSRIANGDTGPRGEPMDGAAQSVLIVDDEELVRWSLGQRLGEHGYRVLQASTARGALPLAGDADVVLLEQQLPDGDGRELAVELRGLRPRRPLILMTAYCGPETRRLARRGVVDAVVEKPFLLDDILRLIRSSLDAA